MFVFMPMTVQDMIEIMVEERDLNSSVERPVY